MSLSPLQISGLKWTVLAQMYHTFQWPKIKTKENIITKQSGEMEHYTVILEVKNITVSGFVIFLL